MVDGVRSPLAQTPNGGPQGSVLTLFCWLIYVNDICASFPTPLATEDCPHPLPDASLLMDDGAVWATVLPREVPKNRVFFAFWRIFFDRRVV